MRIGIDARLYNQTGVGVYIRNLLYYLGKLPTDDLEFYIYLLSKDIDKIEFKNKNFIKRTADFKWHSFSEQTGFNQLLQKDNLQLVHFTYFSYPVMYKKPFIITIHDLTPLLFKTGKASTHNLATYNAKHIAYKFLLKQAVINSKAIITPTDFVKSQILLNFPDIPKTKIHVTYEGINYELTQVSLRGVPTLSRGDTAISKPFFIYVGNFYPHKNVEKMIEAFYQINLNCKLILIGPNDFFCKKIRQLINEKGLKDKIIIYNNSSLPDLIFFYKNAMALIHPSLSEGFGLPILEAQYFNLPIIASDIPVFKEIIGENYYSFNPDNIKDIRNAIENFINQSDKKKVNIKLNLNFSFEKMSKETLDIYYKP